MTDRISENDKIIKMFGEISYRRKNPMSERERIEWYINLAETKLEIALRKLENEPEKILFKQQEALIKKRHNAFKKSSKREIEKDFDRIERKIEKLLGAPGDLRAMIREAKAALKLFEANDIERALRAYDLMHEYRARADLPLRESIKQSKKAKKPRNRGLGPRRAMLKEICQERETFKLRDIAEYLGRFDHRLACKTGAAAKYRCWFDGKRYHFESPEGVPDSFDRDKLRSDLSYLKIKATELS